MLGGSSIVLETNVQVLGSHCRGCGVRTTFSRELAGVTLVSGVVNARTIK